MIMAKRKCTLSHIFKCACLSLVGVSFCFFAAVYVDACLVKVKNIQKKIQQTESAFDVATEDLFNQTIKLEEMEKKANNAEGQVGDLARRLLLMEEQAIKSEERLAIRSDVSF